MNPTTKEEMARTLEQATTDELLQVADLLDEHAWDHALRDPVEDEATRVELEEAGEIADEEEEEESSELRRQRIAMKLADSLWYEYQTFLGYMVRTPTYDEITKNVMKKLKVGGAFSEKRDCWENQNRLCMHLVDKLLDAVEPEDKLEAIQELMGETDKKKLEKELGGSIAKITGGAGALWVSRLSYPVLRNLLLRVVNATARVLLGRGLSFLATQKIFSVVAKRTTLVGFLAGPVGWMLTIWGLNDLTGTNYKKVLPAMLFIYVIHLRLENESAGTEDTASEA